jgi:hypothetical protein
MHIYIADNSKQLIIDGKQNLDLEKLYPGNSLALNTADLLNFVHLSHLKYPLKIYLNFVSVYFMLRFSLRRLVASCS